MGRITAIERMFLTNNSWNCFIVSLETDITVSSKVQEFLKYDLRKMGDLRLVVIALNMSMSLSSDPFSSLLNSCIILKLLISPTKNMK